MAFQVAFIGIDNPHGAGWRDLLLNFPQIEISAIMPGYGGATTSLPEYLAHVPRFETVEQLIAGGQFDGAVVCLPNDVGPSVIAQLARAGKAVLAEKPVGGSADSVREMVSAIDESQVAFQAGYTWRYDECANRLRDMIADDRFGKLINIETTFVTSDVKRRGPDHYLFDAAVSEHGFFNWLACHYLDLLLYVTQLPVTAVTARTGVYGNTPSDVEDGGVVILELGPSSEKPDSGTTIVSFVGGYWIPRWAGEARWTVRGSERWVIWDPGRENTGGVLEVHGPQPQWYAMEETFSAPVDETHGYGGRSGAALVDDWLNCASNGGACRSTPHSVLATLELLDVIYRSSEEGRRIECQIQ